MLRNVFVTNSIEKEKKQKKRVAILKKKTA